MIYIICPWGNATGGTELLHQLGSTLNNLGFEARMYYIGERKGFPPCCPQFEKYRVKRTEYISDNSDDIIIIPELLAKHLDSFDNVRNAKKILWWMSVDNAELNEEDEKVLSKKKNLVHFVQSYYAEDYVLNHLQISSEFVFYLSDYIGTRFLNVPNNRSRQNIVLFNPRKGFEKTSELIKKSNASILWRALEGINGEDMPKYLLNAKVYIDFGNHPGKDRFPREAVSCGCRVITGKRGAASYYKDVMLPDELKIDDSENPDTILDKIYYLVENYEGSEMLYDEYNNYIHEEFHLFEIDTYKVFNKIVNGKNTNEAYIEDDLLESLSALIDEQKYREAYIIVVSYRGSKDRRFLDYSEDFLLLECYVRLGLDQYEIAEYMLNNILKTNPHNYEACILLSEVLYCNIHTSNRFERIASLVERAIIESEDTEDSKLIEARSMEILSALKTEMGE